VTGVPVVNRLSPKMGINSKNVDGRAADELIPKKIRVIRVHPRENDLAS
jgi:hypothetical protein